MHSASQFHFSTYIAQDSILGMVLLILKLDLPESVNEIKIMSPFTDFLRSPIPHSLLILIILNYPSLLWQLPLAFSPLSLLTL